MNRCFHLNKKNLCVNNLAVCPAMLPASLWKVLISSSLGRNNDCYLRFTLTKVFSTSDSHHRRSTEPSRSPLYSVSCYHAQIWDRGRRSRTIEARRVVLMWNKYFKICPLWSIFFGWMVDQILWMLFRKKERRLKMWSNLLSINTHKIHEKPNTFTVKLGKENW